MVSTTSIAWPRILGQGLLAGIVGAITIDVYLWLTTILPAHGSIVALWQFIASTLVGKAAYTSSSFAALGVAMHLVVSICWAAGYAYVASTRPFMNQQWGVSGAGYGVLVYAFMQLILLAGGHFVYPPTPTAFLIVVAAHVFFFGVPVAYVVSLQQQRSAA
ncbi:MAG TPA: hypothetical protein VNG31_05185 [Candidatus Baltobacteraceae bacterium]|nr:hypothetical protein [Candidatus Baltobacteraceae bacterium]